jgi:hypothetical protein
MSSELQIALENLLPIPNSGFAKQVGGSSMGRMGRSSDGRK